MAFNLKGFAGGLADAGTSYFEDKQDRRKDATTAKRSLMFNATEKIYNDALAVKQSNDKIKNDDKQYISKIKSIDPTISTDNMNKLLSLSTDDRIKAEGEYNYRAGQTQDEITFGDFMSAVEESTDLDDTTKIDDNLEASMRIAPKPVSAYYDKTGLISDESVNSMFTEISGVLQEVHGFSLSQAKAITQQGIYSVQHPPIKINWSKAISIERKAAEDLATAGIYNAAKLEEVGLNIINKQVDLTNTSLSSMRKAFAVGYEAEQFDEDEKSLGLKVVPAALAPNMPNFERDFRNSPEYKEYAIASISTYIVGMESDPAFNKTNAMTYINGTFPGMYGGKIETRKLTEAAFKKIEPNKIYYVDSPSPAGTDEDGFIMTGAQLTATRVDSKPKGKDGTGSGGDITDEVSSTVKTLQEQLAFAEEMDAPEETITRIKEEIKKINVEEDKEDRDAQFKAKRKSDAATSAKTFEPDAVTMDAWDKNLDLAIQMGDIGKVQLVIDFVEARPDKTYKSNMSLRNRLSRRSKTALADMTREQNPNEEQSFSKIADSVNSAINGKFITRKLNEDEVKAYIRDLAALEVPTDPELLIRYNNLKSELYEML